MLLEQGIEPAAVVVVQGRGRIAPVVDPGSEAALLVAAAEGSMQVEPNPPTVPLDSSLALRIHITYKGPRGEVPALAWWLLAGNLFWVLAYDTEYAMVDRDDDLKIGIRTSAITLGRFDVAGVMMSYALYLAIWAGLGWWRGFGAAYFIAIAAAAAIAAWHYTLIRHRSRDGCFRAFRLNHWLGFVVFAGVVADHALRG